VQRLCNAGRSGQSTRHATHAAGRRYFVNIRVQGVSRATIAGRYFGRDRAPGKGCGFFLALEQVSQATPAACAASRRARKKRSLRSPAAADSHAGSHRTHARHARPPPPWGLIARSVVNDLAKNVSSCGGCRTTVNGQIASARLMIDLFTFRNRTRVRQADSSRGDRRRAHPAAGGMDRRCTG